MPAACYLQLKNLYTGLTAGAQQTMTSDYKSKPVLAQEELFEHYAAEPGQTRVSEDGVLIGVPVMPTTQRNTFVSLKPEQAEPFTWLTDKTLPKITTNVTTVKDYSGNVDGGGYKASMDDPSKLPIALVPSAAVEGLARVLQYGANKYAANNWRRGMKWSEVYSALQRHLLAWNEGEDTDVSGLNHLDHAMFGVAVLEEYVTHPELYEQFDDRFKRPESV